MIWFYIASLHGANVFLTFKDILFPLYFNSKFLKMLDEKMLIFHSSMHYLLQQLAFVTILVTHLTLVSPFKFHLKLSGLNWILKVSSYRKEG